MTDGAAGGPVAGSAAERRARLQSLADPLRPLLHRYCARLMGSPIEGEDVVQDTFVRAWQAVDTLDAETPLRPWLFRIAHNRAMDLLRGRALRRVEPIASALEEPDAEQPTPEEALMHRQAVTIAVSRFLALPVAQRSVLVLKDVLGESLADIAQLLGLSVDAVKAHLTRGRAQLRQLQATPAPAPPRTPPTSAAVAHYAALFNARDWDALRALLADDVRLQQSAHPARVGRAEVSMFFGIYARSGRVRLVPAWLRAGGALREVLAVFDDEDGPAHGTAPAYLMWLEWDVAGRIRFIRDYRHLPYFMADAERDLAMA